MIDKLVYNKLIILRHCYYWLIAILRVTITILENAIVIDVKKSQDKPSTPLKHTAS